MPLDTFGCTRATMGRAWGLAWLNSPQLRLPFAGCQPCNTPHNWDRTEYLGTLERGISSTHCSPNNVDSVPALCTHRPSLLPIELMGELGGRECCSVFEATKRGGRAIFSTRGNPQTTNLGEPFGLEEGEGPLAIEGLRGARGNRADSEGEPRSGGIC